MKTLTKFVTVLILILTASSTFASPVPTLTRQTLDGRIEVIQGDIAGGRQVYTQAEWLASGGVLPEGSSSSGNLLADVGGNLLPILGYSFLAWVAVRLLGKCFPKKVRA